MSIYILIQSFPSPQSLMAIILICRNRNEFRVMRLIFVYEESLLRLIFS